MFSLPTISPRSWWTGQLMARVPTASTCTSEAPHAISCAAARMDAGGTLSTIIKGLQCDSPPDICAPRQLSAMEPLFLGLSEHPLGNGPVGDVGDGRRPKRPGNWPPKPRL